MKRVNILADPGIARKFITGVLALKDPVRSPWQGQAGLSMYDYFVFWHLRTMMLFTPPTQTDRNAAHSGPVFLPWHRYMLLRFEQALRQVLQDDDFRLPYWDWTADSQLADPRQAPLWDSALLGQFVEGAWRVRVEMAARGAVRVDRPLRRSLGRGGALPKVQDVNAIVRGQTLYDTEPYDSTSQGFRNLLEGWPTGSARVHNNVHVWVGGDMGLATSPNDPVFYLHHCNIDRIWSVWQQQHPASPYVPDQSARADLLMHRLDDPIFSLIEEAVPATPRSMLDHSAEYAYDSTAGVLIP